MVLKSLKMVDFDEEFVRTFHNDPIVTQMKYSEDLFGLFKRVQFLLDKIFKRTQL